MASLAVIVAHAYPDVSNCCVDTLLALTSARKVSDSRWINIASLEQQKSWGELTVRSWESSTNSGRTERWLMRPNQMSIATVIVVYPQKMGQSRIQSLRDRLNTPADAIQAPATY
jgi:hypothetical protein